VPSGATSLRIVFFGDSLTEGTHGASYLAALQGLIAEAPGLSAVRLLNAGVGGDTVENLQRRLTTDVVPHSPDWVVVFIGTNDCTTWLVNGGILRRSIFRGRQRYFAQEKGVTEAINPQRYEAGLRTLVAEIRGQTRAHTALCAPPPVGIEPYALRWRLMARYADAVRRVADEADCNLIDLHARWSAVARAYPRRSLAARWRGLMGELRGDGDADIETLARERGYILTFDGVHFSARGAALAAEVMRDWLATIVPRSDPLAGKP
jgi:lysophospholipase L1-like esterase